MHFNGKRVYKSAFYIKLTFMIRSQPFFSRHEGKSVRVLIFDTRMENGVALWLRYNFLLLFCRPICRHRVSLSCFTKLNLTVTKNQRTTVVFGEDY